MKIVNKISLLILLCLTALAIINVEAGNELVTVRIKIENKTSDRTLQFSLFGGNPNWSGEEDPSELKVCSPAGCEPLGCEVRGDCRYKSKIYFIEPGQTLRFEEEFADKNTGYRMAYCGDKDMMGSLFNDHERNVNQCSTNLKMSTGNGVLKAILTPLE